MADTPTSETEAPTLVGSIVAERYRVEQLLGEGAMGAVYRAEHVHMQKPVALKVLHRDTSENTEVVSRFEREAVAAGRIAHAHVAGATDFGRLGDGSFYLVLEYVAGKSLGAAIEESGPMPATRAAGIAYQIAGALAAAHAAGIVHRDLKPENVMLVNRGPASAPAIPLAHATQATGAREQDYIKVLDFGLAKLNQTDPDDTKLTMVGAVYGTPQYMSPEQAAGNEVDHRADLYALGCIMYEMVAGEAPFTSEQMMPLLIKHMTEPPPPLPDTVPRPLARLIKKLLEKKPEDRYQTADDLLPELDAIARPQVATARSTMGTIPEVAARLGELSVTAKEKSAPALARVRELITVEAKRAWRFLQTTDRIRGKEIPRWVFALAAAIPFAILLAFSSGEGAATTTRPEQKSEKPGLLERELLGGGEKEAEREEVQRKPEEIDPDLLQVVKEAERGSDSALYALEQRSDDDRSVTEWVALGQARLMRREVESALKAYTEAIERDPAVRRDKAMLGALRRLANEREHAEPILEFVAERLGPIAPDFLFDVWFRTSAKTFSTTTAYELLMSGNVKDDMSEALKLALELRDTESCEDFAELLPRVIEVGDERSMNKLRELRKKRGCGPRERDDCYECLRKDETEDLLDEAINQAAMRKAPRFPMLRRWRWR